MGDPATKPDLGSRDRQREETRERLFQAALEEIQRVGLTDAQVDRIVVAAGVARGTFYFHFPTKEDVLLEWERRREADLLARFEGPKTRPRALRASLLEVVRYVVGVHASAEGRRLILDALAMHVREAADLASYPLLTEIERRLAEAAARGEVRDDLDPRGLAILFLSNLFGFLVIPADPRQPHPDANLLVDVFLSGVKAGSRRARRIPSKRRDRS